MDGSIGLCARERKMLLQEIRRGTDPHRRLRAHVLLLLNDGWAWNVIVAVTVHKHWHHQSLEAALSGERFDSGSGTSAWSTPMVAVVDWAGNPMGHRQIASGFRFLPQSLDLRHGGGSAPGGSHPVGQPGNGSALVASREPGVASASARTGTKRIHSVRKNSGEFGLCCEIWLRTRRPCSRTKSTSIPIQKSVPCGCVGDSRPKS